MTTFPTDMPLAEQERTVIRELFEGKSGRLMVSDPHLASAQRDLLETLRRSKVKAMGNVTLMSADDRAFTYAFSIDGKGGGEVTVSDARSVG